MFFFYITSCQHVPYMCSTVADHPRGHHPMPYVGQSIVLYWRDMGHKCFITWEVVSQLGGVEKNNPKTEAEGQETEQKNPVIFYHLVRTAEAVAVGEDTSQLSLDKRWDLSPSVLLSSGFQSGGCHTPPGGHQKLKKIRKKMFVVLNSLICRILLLLNC